MSISARALGLAVVTVLLLHAPVANAQPDAPNLADAKKLTCQFSKMAIGSWTKPGDTQVDIKPADLKLGFENIDTEDGTAEVTGSYGAPYIIVRVAGGYLHFMQVGSTGFLYATTVFNKFVKPGKLFAVHARHEYTEVSLPGYTSRPEQYYGECEVVK